MRERSDDGEVALQGDGHGEVDGARAADADQPVADGDQVHGEVQAVPAKVIITSSVQYHTFSFVLDNEMMANLLPQKIINF